VSSFRPSYSPRSIRFLGIWEVEGWRIKAYGIAYRTEVPSTELVEESRRIARCDLPRPPAGEGRHGVGFIGIHEGRGANLIFLDWWARENELHHLVYLADHARPLRLEPVPRGGVQGCVWDLAVIAFERRAWIANALLTPGAPDLEAYLASRFHASI